MDSERQRQLWSALAANDFRGVPSFDGRADFRGLSTPEPEVLRSFVASGMRIAEVGDFVAIRNARWRRAHFSGAQLKFLRFEDTAVEDCVFDGASCRGWRMWATTFTECSFVKADLRDVSVGATDRGGNHFHKCDFSRADLRGSGHGSATFRGCVFDHAKLAKVDFGGDVFEDCRFMGELREVEFGSKDLGAQFANREQGPPNRMLRVDLRNAVLRWVDFHGLDLSTTLLPNDADHLIVEDAPRVMAAAQARFAASPEKPMRDIAAVFEAILRNLLGGYRTVVHRKDLLELGGEEVVRTFLEVQQAIAANRA